MINRRRFLGAAAALAPQLFPRLRSFSRAAAADAAAPPDITDLLEASRKQHKLPALAAAVISDGRVLTIGAVGVRKLGDPTVVTADDQFHLGSCTKAMTATVAAMLIEEKKLAWDSTLAGVFPDFAGSMHRDLRAMTLDHLLAHRAGLSPGNSPLIGSLRELMDNGKIAGTPREQRLAYARMIWAEKPYEPGKRFAYANRSYVLAGIMMEQAADTAYEDLMSRRLFKPLEMTTAGFGPMGVAGKIEQPWQHRERGGKVTPLEPGPLADNPPVLAPAGTTHSSVGDWAKFVLAHVRGEREADKLLRAETYQRLHTPQFEGDYAGGWQVGTAPWVEGKILSHAGSNTANFAIAWAAPKHDFAVVVMTNQGGTAGASMGDQVPIKLVNRFWKKK